jgi:hypothetical protein
MKACLQEHGDKRRENIEEWYVRRGFWDNLSTVNPLQSTLSKVTSFGQMDLVTLGKCGLDKSGVNGCAYRPILLNGHLRSLPSVSRDVFLGPFFLVCQDLGNCGVAILGLEDGQIFILDLKNVPMILADLLFNGERVVLADFLSVLRTG